MPFFSVSCRNHIIMGHMNDSYTQNDLSANVATLRQNVGGFNQSCAVSNHIPIYLSPSSILPPLSLPLSLALSWYCLTFFQHSLDHMIVNKQYLGWFFLQNFDFFKVFSKNKKNSITPRLLNGFWRIWYLGVREGGGGGRNKGGGAHK